MSILDDKDIFAESVDSEHWRYTDPDEAVRDAFDSIGAEQLSVRCIFSFGAGALEKPNFKSYAGVIEDNLFDWAYDNFGDSCEDWIGEVRGAGFSESIFEFIKGWLDSKKLQPEFGSVENITEVKFEVLSLEEDGALDEYRIIEPDFQRDKHE